MRNLLFALVAHASGLGVRQPPEPTTVTIRSMTITSTGTVTTHSDLQTNATIRTLPPIEPSMASVFSTTGEILGTDTTTATSAITEASVSEADGSCITVTPNLSAQSSPLPPESSIAVPSSTEGNQIFPPTTIPLPRPGIVDPPETPLSFSSVPDTTSSSLVAPSKSDTVGSSTSIGWSISPTTSSTTLLSPASQSSDLPTSTSNETFTTITSSQVASVSTVTTTDGTGHGEATMVRTTDQSSSSFSPTTHSPLFPSHSTTIHVVAINRLGY
ncbi:hypothetical protein F4814DRAFT_460839 [Daldinia grandis]|nr:hypothetical protein F4814DRAFT_460839 [Daldinia grandis]